MANSFKVFSLQGENTNAVVDISVPNDVKGRYLKIKNESPAATSYIKICDIKIFAG